MCKYYGFVHKYFPSREVEWKEAVASVIEQATKTHEQLTKQEHEHLFKLLVKLIDEYSTEYEVGRVYAHLYVVECEEADDDKNLDDQDSETTEHY